MKVIRGESPLHPPKSSRRDSGEISIDTFSFTLPLSDVSKYRPDLVTAPVDELAARYGYSPRSDTVDSALAAQPALWLFLSELLPFGFADEIGQGKNNFTYSRAFQDDCGFVAWGGNDSHPLPDGTIKRVPARFQVYITGNGCMQVQDWGKLADALSAFADVRITRLDIAYDDHKGHRSVDDARGLYLDGAFTSSGRPPKATFIDDMGNGHGRTMYVGNRSHGKLLRVYEKGKQLGDKLSSWVRWEIEFKNKHRVIPLDALRNPADFLAGAYPALHWISEVRQVVRTVREKADVTVNHLVQCARTAYGKLFSFLQHKGGYSSEEIFNSLGISGGVPKRLSWAKSFSKEELEICLS